MKVSTDQEYIILDFLPIGQERFRYCFKVGTKAEDLYKMIEQTTKLRYGVAEDFMAEFDCGMEVKTKLHLSHGDYIDLKRFILKYEHNYDAIVEESIPPRRIINAIMELGL